MCIRSIIYVILYLVNHPYGYYRYVQTELVVVGLDIKMNNIMSYQSIYICGYDYLFYFQID
jgi:hypothetical protein